MTLVESGAYCANATGVDNHSSFGYTLASCAAAVGKSSRCAAARAAGSLFYYSEGYNGQCTCARDACTKVDKLGTYSIYRPVKKAHANPPTKNGVEVTNATGRCLGILLETMSCCVSR